MEGEPHEKAVDLLKAAQGMGLSNFATKIFFHFVHYLYLLIIPIVGTVKLVVRYTPKVLEEMEARFDKQRTARRRQQMN